MAKLEVELFSSDRLDYTVLVDLNGTETEPPLLGRTPANDSIIIEFTQEIMNATSLPLHVADIIARYKVPLLENFDCLALWFKQCDASRIYLNRISYFLILPLALNCILDTTVYHYSWKDRMLFPDLCLISLITSVATLSCAFVFCLRWAAEYKKLDVCFTNYHLGTLLRKQLFNGFLKPLAPTTLKNLEEKLKKQTQLSCEYLNTKQSIYFEVSLLLSSLSFIVGVLAIVHYPDLKEVAVSTQASGSASILLSSFGLYKNRNMKEKIKSDLVILSEPYPQYSRLNYK